MIEPIVRRFLDTPHRRLIIISATFGIAVLILLPLADRYFAQLKKQDQLALLLKDAQQVAASLDPFQKRVDEVVEKLEAAEARTVSPEELNAFRGAVVRMARDSRCQIRRIDVGGVNTRAWKGANLIQAASSSDVANGEFRFDLTSQTLSLQVTGGLAEVKTLLERLHEQGVLMHTKSFGLRPYGADRREAILDIEFILYSLQQAKKQAA